MVSVSYLNRFMIKKIIKKIFRLLSSPFIIGDYLKYVIKNKDERFKNSIFNFYPCLKDKTIQTGFDRHYIYHIAWAARKIKQINPSLHYDLSSSLYFVGVVSANYPVKFYDYRPANLILDNLDCQSADLQALPFDSNSLNSLSCMHVVEHVGLGRYGEPIDPSADIKAIAELKRVVMSGGNLLFVVPLGHTAKIEYNAHRIYTYDMVIKYFDGFLLKEFAYIPENEGGMVIDIGSSSVVDAYGCGCFWFVKK